MSKKKPTTAGEKIVKGTHIWHPSAFKSPGFDRVLASRIDRAIARAVKKERERCIKCLQVDGLPIPLTLLDGSNP